MAHSGARNLRDGTIIISDGTGTPNTCTVELEEGTLQWTEDRTARQVKDRGALSHFRTGDQNFVALSFSFMMDEYQALTAGAAAKPYEALTKSGMASAWASVGESYEPYLVDIIFKVANPNSSANREVLQFDNFHADTVEVSEGDPNMISVSGAARCVAPTQTEESQS